MQNLYNYIQYFKAHEIEDKPYKTFKNKFEAFDVFYKNNVPTNRFGFLSWSYKSTKHYDPIYNNILKIYAEYLGVKVQYRDHLDEFEKPTEGYYFIGDEQRICILKALWDYTLYMIEEYKKGKSKKLASFMVNTLVSNIIELVKKLLVTDLRYDYYLENYIQIHFKIDYKKYQSEKQEYFHGISNKYHNKRLML